MQMEIHHLPEKMVDNGMEIAYNKQLVMESI